MTTSATQPTMSTAHKVSNIVGVALPFVGFLAAVALLWDTAVGWRDLAIALVLYGATGLGITVGFHRLLTHRAFDTYRPIRYLFAIFGSMAVQGPVLHWVSDHRKHHAYTDEDGDPHSPHLAGGGVVGALRGLWHAHTGWLFEAEGRADPRRYARDLLRDRGMIVIDRLFLGWTALGLLIPFAIGLAVSGSLFGGLTALLWGGLVRIFLLHHVTFSINSLCHFIGARRFRTGDASRNLFWLAPISFGEAWHNNHHAFPTSAFHGLRLRELDPGGLVIRALERLGLAWNVVRVPRERQAAASLPHTAV
jgi:stearoyl-CoA desaturase (Delta-9 desaturase)